MKARYVVIGSALVVALSAFLPWASFLRFSKTGVEGDGIVTLALAIIGVALMWRGWGGWLAQIVLAALVVLVGLYDLNDAGNLAASGLYLTFLAGIVWVLGAMMLRAARPAAEPEINPLVREPGSQ